MVNFCIKIAQEGRLESFDKISIKRIIHGRWGNHLLFLFIKVMVNDSRNSFQNSSKNLKNIHSLAIAIK